MVGEVVSLLDFLLVEGICFLIFSGVKGVEVIDEVLGGNGDVLKKYI